MHIFVSEIYQGRSKLLDEKSQFFYFFLCFLMKEKPVDITFNGQSLFQFGIFTEIFFWISHHYSVTLFFVFALQFEVLPLVLADLNSCLQTTGKHQFTLK